MLVGAAPNLTSAKEVDRKQKADALTATAGPVQPVAGVRFNPREKAVQSWLYAMIPCPSHCDVRFLAGCPVTRVKSAIPSAAKTQRRVQFRCRYCPRA